MHLRRIHSPLPALETVEVAGLTSLAAHDLGARATRGCPILAAADSVRPGRGARAPILGENRSPHLLIATAPRFHDFPVAS